MARINLREWFPVSRKFEQLPKFRRVVSALAADKAALAAVHGDVMLLVEHVAFSATLKAFNQIRIRLGSSTDDRIEGDLAAIDEAGALPGLGRAWVAAGWAVERDGFVELPNFSENNPPMGKSGQERTAAWRDRHGIDVTPSDAVSVTVTETETETETESRTRNSQQREKNGAAASASPLRSVPEKSKLSVEEQFAELWSRYPRRNGKRNKKAEALAVWRRMTLKARREAYASLSKWVKSLGDEHPPDAVVYLRRRRWEDLADYQPATGGSTMVPTFGH